MSSLHFVLESLFFLSGIALTVIAAIGLRQLTVAKEIARIGAKRDSLKLAADQCAHYMHNIIPLQNALYEAIQTKHIAFFDKSEVEVKGDQVKVTSTATPADVDALKTIAYEFLAAFNAIEAFAVFFVSGVADEKLAFSALGASYCSNVQRYLPEIMLLRSGSFDNLLRLFFLWNSRLESLRLRMERDKIDNSLQKIQNKFIKPVGT
ncbi:MAG: hypothetical protein DME33_00865 [Verrucomicrobia bacterium]|nr:MAG: hypothetical protein DME33_00865 [Verrucomicrobiota bacterium]